MWGDRILSHLVTNPDRVLWCVKTKHMVVYNIQSDAVTYPSTYPAVKHGPRCQKRGESSYIRFYEIYYLRLCYILYLSLVRITQSKSKKFYGNKSVILISHSITRQTFVLSEKLISLK